MNLQCKPIAHIENDYTDKFGIPRQSGLAQMESRIVFLPEYRVPDALRGIDGYSHLWILWIFSKVNHAGWNPTVRPPKLGGNIRMGVFATRSPFRPNPIGLSSVSLLGVERDTPRGDILLVSGADLLHGTPILDIKPYLAYTDCHPNATSGFAVEGPSLSVDFPPDLLAKIPSPKQQGLLDTLAQDPRPAYQNDPSREYWMDYGTYVIGFRVTGHCLSVFAVE